MDAFHSRLSLVTGAMHGRFKCQPLRDPPIWGNLCTYTYGSCRLKRLRCLGAMRHELRQQSRKCKMISNNKDSKQHVRSYMTV